MGDSGCERGVSGPDGHRTLTNELAKFGLKPIKVDKKEEFQFGDGNMVTSDCAFLYPCFLKGNFVGHMSLARVSVPCPPLFSKNMLKEWCCDLNFGEQSTNITRFGVKGPFRQGSPIVNVLDFGGKKKVGLVLKVPNEFHIK